MELGEHDQVIENIHNDVFNGAIYREVDRVIFQPIQDAESEISDGEIGITEDNDSNGNFGTDISCSLPGIQTGIETPSNGILGLSNRKFEEKRLRAGFCQICKRQYANLSIHEVRIHKGSAKKYKCSTCGKEYHTKVGLDYHTECHSEEKPYKCQECGKTFNLESNVRFHMHNTHRNQQTLCPFCGKCLYSAFSLKRHLRLHTGKRPFKCETCGMSFAYRNVLRDHKLIHSGMKPFKCDLCKREFRQRSTLTQHIKYVHNGVKNLQCEKCDLKFSRPSYLRQHVIRSHNKNKQRFGPCPKCGKYYSHAHTLKRHVKTHSDSCHRCDICQRLFNSKALLQKHMGVYKGRKPYVCLHCGKSFHSKQNAEKHERKKHTSITVECEESASNTKVEIEIIAEEFGNEETPSKSVECLNSDVVKVEVLNDVDSESKDELIASQLQKGQTSSGYQMEINNDYRNPLDGNSSIVMVDFPHSSLCAERPDFGPNAVTDNERYSENMEEAMLEDVQPYDKMVDVTACSIEPTTSFHLKTHLCVSLDGNLTQEYVLQSSPEGFEALSNATSMDLETSLPNDISNPSMMKNGRPVWVCDVCGKETTNMARHKKFSCDNSEAFEECGICNKAVRPTRMKYHMKTHKERQFSCHLCAKKFIIKSALTNHMRVHRDEKPFKCELCQKSFRIEETLKKHIRCHTGERPYPCRICGLRFGHLKVRSDHEKIHTGEKPHVCNICGKSFRQRSTLRSHWAIHTTDKNFECDVCGKKFSRKNDLQQHVKRHDKERSKFKCEQCGNEYAEHYSLLKHLKWHNKFPCETCNRRFDTKNELAKHEKKFEGKQPFSCGICNKKYHSKASVLRHMIEHTGQEKRTYKCEECGSCFRSDSALKKHTAKFLGKDLFECRECSKKFHLQKLLTSHEVSCTKRSETSVT